MAKKKIARKGSTRGTKQAKKPSAPNAAKTKAASAPKKSQARSARKSPPAAGKKRAGQSAVFPIVAVGASAGGLEAFTELLNALPADSGMSFVFIQHLSEATESMLPEILARATTMPVTAVTRDVHAKQNHVYVIPPNFNLSFSNHVIHVEPRPKTYGPHMPIDLFMRSLAEECKTRAIGVILSGTGSDGTQGLAAIKAEGGITFAQDETSAKYVNMPRSAAATPGIVDFVLPPKEIAAELVRITRHPYLNHVAKAPEPPKTAPEPEDQLKQIFALIRKRGGVDFSYYKPATIQRRISRRMMLHKIDLVKEYIKVLEKDGREVEALQHDLLISVTNFFRDPEAFQVVQEKFLPKILADRSADEPIRAWAPGCATGEEAYTVAICLLEALGDQRPEPPLQIFGTDVSEGAVAKAREGLYPENIVADVSRERLRRFFVKSSGGYQVNKSVRDLCVFAVQNVVKDPPFSRLDLISCRNVLIYLEPTLQERVLNILHYALKPNGILLLGASETAGAASNLFRLEDRKHKVYFRRPGAGRMAIDLGSAHHLHAPASKVEEPKLREADIEREANQLVLNQYAPPGVVVNESMDVVLFRGQTSPFLQPPAGKPTFNILKMAREELLLDLRAIIHKARQSAAPARREGLALQINGENRKVNLIAVPLASRENNCMVLFEDVTAQAPPKSKSAATKPQVERQRKKTVEEREIVSLRKELNQTKRDLQAIIQEQESTNEELQSANEEILSSNEELQSTNEELQTAKEELQATNEELTTVNEEMHNRNAELTQANNDLTNLFASVDVGIAMLDRNLQVRHFTPAAGKILNLIPADIGRPITNIKPKIKIDDLEELLPQVIDELKVVERDVRDQQGHCYSMRIRPYKTADNKIAGAVLVFLDVDHIRRLTTAESARLYAENIVDTVREPLVVLDQKLRVVSANRSFYRTFQVAMDKTEGSRIYALGNRQWNIPRLRTLLEEIIPTHSSFEDFKVEHEFPGLGRRVMLLNARQVAPQEGGEKLILLAIEDVTDRAATANRAAKTEPRA